MNFMQKTLIASLITLGMSASASAATLNVSNGILMGAYDVNVNGTLYDVLFKDGLLNGGVSAFTDSASAQAASQALLTQVFNTGIFDTNPEKTNGCRSIVCGIVTVYRNNGYYVAGNRLNNYSRSTNDSSDDVTEFVGEINLADWPTLTLALWTKSSARPAATAVPEPEAYAMMLAGLGLVGFAARRKKQAV